MDFNNVHKILGGNGEYKFLPDVEVPKVNTEAIRACRQNCATCKEYGHSYVCPPYVKEEEILSINDYEGASLLVKEYEIPDGASPELAVSVFQNLCRMIKKEMDKSGLNVLSLAEGKCSHCENCNCLRNEPCGNPSGHVGPMCGYGINPVEYAKQLGMEFHHEGNKMTMYGLFLRKGVSSKD